MFICLHLGCHELLLHGLYDMEGWAVSRPWWTMLMLYQLRWRINDVYIRVCEVEQLDDVGRKSRPP